jgi:hypothetical protein
MNIEESIQHLRSRDKTLKDIDADTLIELFGINDSSFLNTTLSMGIITSEETDKMYACNEVQNKNTWLPVVAGSFIFALYDIVWKIRTRKVQLANSQMVNKKKRELERQEKSAKENRARALAILKKNRKRKERKNESSTDEDSTHTNIEQKRQIVKRIIIRNRPLTQSPQQKNTVEPEGKLHKFKQLLIRNKQGNTQPDNSLSTGTRFESPEHSKKKSKKPPDKSETQETDLIGQP